MNRPTRTRRIRHAMTWIGGGALSAVLLVPAAHAGPLDDLRELHRMHRRVHQEVRREVRHTVRHIIDGDHHRNRRHQDRRELRHAPRGHHRHGYRHVPPGHARHERHFRPRPYHVDRRFHVPPRIEGRYVQRYRPYYEGSVWFEPHGHRHDVYRFPVATSRGHGYEPHYYCDGTRFRLDYDRPGLHVNIGF